MIYNFFQPSLPLKSYVKTYHLLHFKLKEKGVNPAKTYFPQPEQCLTFDLKGRITALNKQTGLVQYRSASYLSQQQVSAYDLSLNEEYLMLKVVFHPGGLYHLLQIPLYELGGQYLDAESVIPKEIRQINEQLACACTYDRMINIVDSFLVNKVKKAKVDSQPFDKVCQSLSHQINRLTLNQIADYACLSPRQLERKFLERIGVSPVTYRKVSRFHEAVNLKEKSPQFTWFEIAIACGYTDLAHLVKDFKQFSGTTPTSVYYQEQNTIHKKLELI